VQRHAYKYPLRPFEVKALCLIAEHPGITATHFAAMYWPHLKKGQPARLAAEHLGGIVKKKLLRKKFIPDPFKGGPIPPKGCYFLTARGYDVYEYWSRQRISENDDPPHQDRTRGAGD
jgi:hypothetical protein